MTSPLQQNQRRQAQIRRLFRLLKPEWHCGGGFVLICVVICLTRFQATAQQTKDVGSINGLTVRAYSDRISVAKKKRDVGAMLEVMSQVDEEWHLTKNSAYLRLLAQSCEGLQACGIPTREQSDIVRTRVTKALDAEADRPAEIEMKLMLLIQGDWTNPDNVLNQDKWCEERDIRTRRWLRVWREFNKAKEKAERESGGVVYSNVEPPRGSGVLPGASPSEIKDPRLRKEYEQAIADNVRRAQLNRTKDVLNIMEPEARKAMARFISNIYGEAPEQTEALSKLLVEYGVEKKVAAAILTETNHKIGARIKREEENRKGKLRIEIKEPEPRGIEEHHRDPRLRSRLTIHLIAPKIDSLLQSVSEKTRVELSHANDVQSGYSAVASASYVEVPAWEIMDHIAASKQVEGRWEKHGTGYRLIRNGNAVAIEEMAQSQSAMRPGSKTSSVGSGYQWSGAAVLAIIVLVSIVTWRVFPRKQKR